MELHGRRHSQAWIRQPTASACHLQDQERQRSAKLSLDSGQERWRHGGLQLPWRRYPADQGEQRAEGHGSVLQRREQECHCRQVDAREHGKEPLPSLGLHVNYIIALFCFISFYFLFSQRHVQRRQRRHDEWIDNQGPVPRSNVGHHEQDGAQS